MNIEAGVLAQGQIKWVRVTSASADLDLPGPRPTQDRARRTDWSLLCLYCPLGP